MKKILTSETFLGIIASIVFSILLVWAFIWATEPEQWYAGMHDSQCEKTLYDEPCECYERLVAADKAKYGKK
jgi:nitrogen fixation-related uncharacterized protein